ncbi:MAG: hypothetical protein JXB24_08410, partial [Bacteroidales bacterium]|nr:hypothetical protein [Bacteroidales bacterium]
SPGEAAYAKATAAESSRIRDTFGVSFFVLARARSLLLHFVSADKYADAFIFHLHFLSRFYGFWDYVIQVSHLS